jgi:hypothetical protein
MFISVNIDMATTDHVDAIDKVLKEYGIKKVQDRLYESSDFITKSLGNLKKDISDIVDSDDKVRMYQFPLDDCFKISYLEEHKWKRLSVSIPKS